MLTTQNHPSINVENATEQYVNLTVIWWRNQPNNTNCQHQKLLDNLELRYTTHNELYSL